MRKITMMAACFALLLSSCVTNEESQSVTDIRNAKAEQLKSLAALNNAEAETAKVLAAAEAAYKAAEAELKKAEAAKLAADAENEKVVAEAQAELLKAQAALEAAKAAQIEEQIEKAKLEYDALKAEYAARIAQAEQAKAEAEKAKADAIAAMELAKVTAEKELVKAQKQLAEQKQKLKEKLEQIEAENAVTIEALYAAYVEATGYYQRAVIDLNSMKGYVAGVQAGLVSSEEALAALLESYESDIEEYVNAIALAEAKIATLEEYKGVPAEEIRAALVEANANHFALSQAYLAAAEVAADMLIDTKLVDANYILDTYGLWDTKYSVYTDIYGTDFSKLMGGNAHNVLVTDEDSSYDFFKIVYLDKDGNETEDYETSWYGDVYGATPWVAITIEVDGEEKVLPLFTVTPDYPYTSVQAGWNTDFYPANYIEYENPYSTDMFPSTYKAYYNQIERVGAVNKDSFKAWADAVTTLTEEIKNIDENTLAEAARLKTLVEALVEPAAALQSVYDAFNHSMIQLSTETIWDETLEQDVPTVLGAYNNAVSAEESAKAAYELALPNLETMEEQLAYYDTKEYRWAMEDNITVLKEKAAEADKVLKAAQDTLAVKEKALAAALKVQKSAAKDLEDAEYDKRDADLALRDAEKALAAAEKVVEDAGANATQAQKDAVDKAEDAVDKAKDAVKDAADAVEDAKDDLNDANQDVAEAQSDVDEAQSDVDEAQSDVDEAYGNLESAESSRDGFDTFIENLKNKIAWAKEDIAELEAAWKAAVATLEEAKAAYEAVKAEYLEAATVLEAGVEQRAWDVAYEAVSEFETEDYLVQMRYEQYVMDNLNDGDLTYPERVENALEYCVIDNLNSVAEYDGVVESILEFCDNAVEYLAEAEKEAAEFNELAKAYAEAYVAAELADYEAGNAYAEVTALNTALSEATDPDGIAAQIAALEGDIETAKDAIEGIEEAIEQAKTAVDNNQDVVAMWEAQLASVQAYVELCEAQVAAAKAEFDAAVEAAAKAE